MLQSLENPTRTLRGFQAALDLLPWCIISAKQADQPARVSMAADVMLQTHLSAWVRSGRIMEAHPVQGVWRGESEQAYLLINCRREDAMRLCVAYGQECVATHKGLLWADGRVTPTLGALWGGAASGLDGYTVLPEGTAFALILDETGVGEVAA